MKSHICFIMILPFLWLLASCRNAGDTTLSSSDYCLIFYGSGGDEAHTATIEGYRNAIEAILPESDAAVTWILKSDKADEQTFRYFSADGTFRKDSTWTGDTAFDITSSANLAEFIKWSASRFPDRNYVLVTAGHGTAWRPDPGHEGEYGLLYDGITRRSMSAEDLAKGIGMSEVKIETLLTNNCLQGSVETLAEWSGYADYVVYGNSYLPDLGGDYPYYIKLLDGGSDMRCILHDYVRHCGDVFNNVLYPFEDGGSSLTAMDLTHFDAILSAAGKAFAEMGRSMERTSTVTDPPCEYGRSFADGYRAALNSSLQMDMLGSTATHDLYDFLYNSVLFTGHPELFCCLGEFRDALEEAVILNMHNMNLDSHKLSFNVCTEPDDFTGENLEAYRSSRFDQATGWSDFYTSLIGKDHKDDLKGLISE